METNAETIASIAATGAPMSQAQIRHRLEAFDTWKIAPGSRVLEIGCGQGDGTVVLAHLVGPAGHVTGLDPAPLDYGSPMTLGEAQAKLKAGPLGSRITFQQSTLQAFLASDAAAPVYDYAVFCRCLWYFPSPDSLLPLFAALRGRARKLLVAQYTLDTRGDLAALPHLLAALSQGALNCGAYHPASDIHDNVQCVITPSMIRDAARKEGWQLEIEEIVEAALEVEDAQWEVDNVLSERYIARVNGQEDVSRQDYGRAILEALETAKSGLGPASSLRTLPSWLGTWT
ncbi:hypothetical protein SPI_05460 [Niveomyces insectorum RCEF 264]|uniref:Methyltransferase domain-containing protein n=1 Tax=Niveomyces insectorum RCEF 264 TaxID=1081102 RepID=A0A167T8S4_9HYPO|nr:hypothetical protein SPI_05460 [Niveomyces insectorum RCEF 264]